MDAGYWSELVRPIVAGQKLVLTGNPVGATAATVRQLREYGAADVLVLGDGMGTGPLPDCQWIALENSAPSMMAAIRAGQAALADLPRQAQDALDRFDPHRAALVIGSFLNELTDVGGRRCLAWRKPEWVALEDKVVIDELWDAVGVTRVPSRVVSVDDLGPETGVVWAGDALGGFHGGADLTRWIRTEADVTAARQLMQAHCRRVRVMPFLEGIPCSIHGIVFRDAVAALRPVEMVTLRRGSAFFYAGTATFWDPPGADRDAMRDIARRVGAALRDRVDFRGAFTVDGVMTTDGFRPTELNPRMGAGLAIVARVAPEVPIELLHQALMADLDLDYRPSELEALLVDTADARRGGGTWKPLASHVEPRENEPLQWTGDAWTWASPDGTPDATFNAGPSSVGAFVRLALEPDRTPAGPSIGRRAAAFYAFCDDEFGTGIGPLDAAQDVRQ